MKLNIFSLYLILIVTVTACGGEDTATPKPRGYFRIELPEKKYQQLEIDCPYTFEYNSNAEWQNEEKGFCWGDVYYPSLRARLQLTYKSVQENDIETLLKDGQELAYKHVVKANGIGEKLYTDSDREVYGILYRIQGEAASNTQFFMTDSTEHFLRGVLYFYAEPNEDSLRPVNEYMYNEVIHLIETLKWQSS